MNTKELLTDLIGRNVDFTIYTNVAYGRGLNGVDYNCYSKTEVFGDNLKTKVNRTFEPKEDHLVITEEYTPPEIPWNRAAEKKPYARRIYLGYDKITYIKEYIEI